MSKNKNGNGAVAMPPKIEVKNVKHVFTPEERDTLGGDLARSFATLRGIENEFDQVKSSYKAKTSEAEARIDNLSTARMNGFDMRNERCRVEFKPKERKKYYFLEEAPANSEAILVEDMTQDDFQADLLAAESKFEKREEIEIFRTESDFGILTLGRFDGKWFGSLRVKIGTSLLSERLDSEQPCCKQRFDMAKKSLKRLNEWLVENLGKDSATGFQGQIADVLEAHKEMEE